LVTDSYLTNIGQQQLDEIFFFRTTFDHCVLVYSGGPFIFDRSNIVRNSELLLLKGANPNSKAIAQFKSDFPDVRVFDETAVNGPVPIPALSPTAK
jgi:hypothetical protein